MYTLRHIFHSLESRVCLDNVSTVWNNKNKNNIEARKDRLRLVTKTLFFGTLIFKWVDSAHSFFSFKGDLFFAESKIGSVDCFNRVVLHAMMQCGTLFGKLVNFFFAELSAIDSFISWNSRNETWALTENSRRRLTEMKYSAMAKISA